MNDLYSEVAMKKNKLVTKLYFLPLLLLILYLVISAYGRNSHLWAKTSPVPYKIWGEMKKNSGGFENAFEYEFTNLTQKNIKKLEMIISLFDGDGEPALESDYVTINLIQEIESNQTVQGIVDLSPYLIFNPDTPYFTDYFYVKKIIFEDDSYLEDLFGRWGQK